MSVDTEKAEVDQTATVGNQQSSASIIMSESCPFVKQATEAFLVFDSDKTETVDVREVGTIIRSLGLFY